MSLLFAIAISLTSENFRRDFQRETVSRAFIKGLEIVVIWLTQLRFMKILAGSFKFSGTTIHIFHFIVQMRIKGLLLLDFSSYCGFVQNM